MMLTRHDLYLPSAHGLLPFTCSHVVHEKPKTQPHKNPLWVFKFSRSFRRWIKIQGRGPALYLQELRDCFMKTLRVEAETVSCLLDEYITHDTL